MEPIFFGWDVGGWNSDEGTSRDALFALEGTSLNKLSICGSGRGYRPSPSAPFRDELLHSRDPSFLLELLGIQRMKRRVVLAIDAPLQWSTSFVELIQGRLPKEVPGNIAAENPIVFRLTERLLADFSVVSAVRDRIGSQATKAQFFLRQFGANPVRPGVFSMENGWTVVETFPRVARMDLTTRRRVERFFPEVFPNGLGEKPAPADCDLRDALLCAYIAAVFELGEKDELVRPLLSQISAAESEGWIWRPSAANPQFDLRGKW